MNAIKKIIDLTALSFCAFVVMTPGPSLAFFSWEKKGGRGELVAKIEGDVGHSVLKYKKTYRSDGSNDLEFTQNGLKVRGLAEAMVIPSCLWMGGAFEGVFPREFDIEERFRQNLGRSCCEIKISNYKGYARLWFPARPANFSLLAEYSGLSINGMPSEIGHKQISGWQYGGQLDMTAPSGQSIYMKWYPLRSDVKYSEIQFGVQLKLLGGSSKKPYSLFKGGILVNLDYRRIVLSNNPEGIDKGEIGLKEYTATVGIRF